MTKEEKVAAKNLAEAFVALPDNKREYLMGFAEGVAAMKSKEEQKEEE